MISQNLTSQIKMNTQNKRPNPTMAHDFSDLSSNSHEDDLPRPSRTWLEAFKRQLLREDDTESETDMRIPRSRICHRPHLLTFEDTRDAAEGLRSGIPQIINLTETTPEAAQRFLDFLQGVIYVIQGYQTYLSPTIFLFTPGTVEIQQEKNDSVFPAPRAKLSPPA